MSSNKIETLLNCFMGVIIGLGFTFGFGYLGYKFTENYCPCCFGCSFCIYGGWCCLVPMISLMIGMGLGLTVLSYIHID